MNARAVFARFGAFIASCFSFLYSVACLLWRLMELSSAVARSGSSAAPRVSPVCCARTVLLIASLRRFRPYLWTDQSKVTSTSCIERERARQSAAGERERERERARASERASERRSSARAPAQGFLSPCTGAARGARRAERGGA